MTLPASVVVPTHNRQEAVKENLVSLLSSARHAGAEVLVVDDGSSPPLTLAPAEGLRVFRTLGVERSRARNLGALEARGELLVFLDDDMSVSFDFVEQHVRGAGDFSRALAVGRVVLPAEMKASPFGRFRSLIEESEPPGRPRESEPGGCTAANMSMRRGEFLDIGGFDPGIVSGEDQDLALRFCSKGGRVVFLPDARSVHCDSRTSIYSYTRRHEWGARTMAPFILRYPDAPENRARAWSAKALRRTSFPAETTRLAIRLLLSRDWPLWVIEHLVRMVERAGLEDGLLFPLYRSLLGLRLFRGFRTGLRETLVAPPSPGSLQSAKI